MRRTLFFAFAILVAAVAVPVAGASELIDRDASNVKLSVNTKGEALLTYIKGGQPHRVLAWGAINAIPSAVDAEQVKLQLDYQGGWKRYFVDNSSIKALQSNYRRVKSSGKPYLHLPVVKNLAAKSSFAKNYWQDSFGGSCPKYTGPKLAWFLTACRAPDGSLWAIQQWQRQLPNYGLTPNKTQSVWELRLSHWTGEIPKLEITMDWSWHRWEHLYGKFTYLSTPVYGFRSTPQGQPLDSFGRNLYVDTLDSAYGAGWKRENSFLTHTNTGVFCYSINPHSPHPAGTGSKYRATIIGPGVTPDLMWEGVSPGAYDKAADATHNEAISALKDTLCKPN